MAAPRLPRGKFAKVALFSLLGAALLARVGLAQTTYLWTGASGPPYLWSSSGNWFGGVAPPLSGSSILSFGTTVGSTAPSTAAAYSVQRLEFHDAQSYSISGSAISLGPGGIGSSCSADCAVSNAITLQNDVDQDWTNTGLGRLTAGAVNLNGRSLAFHAGSGLNPGPIDVNGVISGTGSLFKHGPGVLTLRGANTYVGNTSVLGGTLRTGANNVIPAGAVSVRSGTLDLNGFSEVIGPGSVVDTGLVMGAYPTVGSAAGTTSAVHSPDTPLSISTTGTFIAFDATGSPGTAEITGALDLGTTAGTRTIDVGNSAATVDLKISADIVNLAGNSGMAPIIDKTGAGRLELSGAGSFPRQVRVSAGVLRVSNAFALGATGAGDYSYLIDGATIELSPGVTTAEALALYGSGVNGSGALRGLAGGTSEWAGLISVGEGATRIGVDAGAVLVCDHLNGGGTSEVLTLLGGGTVVFPNPNSYDSDTVVESGTTFRVTNASGSAAGRVVVLSGARLEGTGRISFPNFAPGSVVEPGGAGPGTLQCSSGVFESGSILRIKATSASPAGCARFSATGPVNLAGTLEFSTTFTPAKGDSFVVLTCGSRFGTFANTALPALPNDRAWLLQYGPTSVVLRVTDPLQLDAPPSAPRLTALERVAPNPFVHETTIGYALTTPGRVDLQVFDASGRRVANLVDGAETPAGLHQASWPGRDDTGRACRPGLYWIRLSVDGVALAPKPVSLSR